MTHFLGVMVTSHLQSSSPALSHINNGINSSFSFSLPLLFDNEKNCCQLEKEHFALIFFCVNNHRWFYLDKNLC